VCLSNFREAAVASRVVELHRSGPL
jgi:hypothetical protein